MANQKGKYTTIASTRQTRAKLHILADLVSKERGVICRLTALDTLNLIVDDGLAQRGVAVDFITDGSNPDAELVPLVRQLTK